jgi:hypothetical protein
MFSGDQQKPYGRFDTGPETAPQVKLAYHGQGTPHQMVYTSNPVSWLMDLFGCLPFFNLSSANTQAPVDAAIIDELDTGAVPSGPLIGGGSVWFNGNIAPPMPGGAVNPRMDTTVTGSPIPIAGFAPSGTPLGQTADGRVIPLYGSRKTIGVPYTPNISQVGPQVGTVNYK